MRHSGWLITLAILCALALSAVILACGSEEPTERRESTRAERATTGATPEAGRTREAASTLPAEDRGRSRSIFPRTSAETDREALEALYNATGGPSWAQDDNWLSDEPVSEWYGVEVDDDERVTGLYLGSNNLVGEIPPDIGDLEELALLDLQQNLLSGEIPTEFGNLGNLKFLVLLLNELSGEIPAALGNLTNLEVLALNGNRLSGEIPAQLGNLTSLTVLSLDNNQLTGEIPRELGELSSLTDLNLQFNLLAREIPAELENLHNLKNLWLSGNRLSGEIPPELGNLEGLESLLLGDNRLQGEIPPELGNLSRLITLALYLNQLSGKIPAELASLSNLETLALGGNRLAGYVPPELGNLSNLRILAISENLLEGCVPRNLERQLDMRQSSLGYLPFCTVIALATPAPRFQPTPLPGPTVTPAPRAQAVPAPQATPVPTAPPQTSGGPGAVYRGDGNWAALTGPAVRPEFEGQFEFGDSDGQVPLDAILQHQWIFESGYYRSLVDKAGLDNPTPLTSSGRNITLEFACLNSRLYWCRHLETYFVPNVAERTNGQVTIEVSSFPELGLSGPDTGVLLAEGSVEMAEIYGGYIAASFPSWELQSLRGLWPDDRTRFEAETAMAPGLDQIVAGDMDSQPLFRNWIADGGLFLFSDVALETPEDFGGLKIRSFSASLSDWISGMGGDAQFVAFSEIYYALERSILDAGVTNASAAYTQRWYEVADYMNGPFYSLDSTIVAVSNHDWDGIPTDLQQILIEEGARQELESLRLATIQGITAMERITGAGIQIVEFSPEIRAQSRRVAIECVIPGWLKRVGHPSASRCTGSIVPAAQSTTPRSTPAFRPTPAAVVSPTGPTPSPTASGQQTPTAEAVRAVDLFNRSVGPVVGLRIEADGSVTELR